MPSPLPFAYDQYRLLTQAGGLSIGWRASRRTRIAVYNYRIPNRSGIQTWPSSRRGARLSPTAAEGLEELDPHRLIYHLPKPGPDGPTQLILLPLELIERIAARVPPPRMHRHRHYGVWAPNAPLRAAVTALVPQPVAVQPSAPAHTAGDEPLDTPHRSPARHLWAMLLARIYEAFPLTCPTCGTAMRIVAFITETSTVQRILNHVL